MKKDQLLEELYQMSSALQVIIATNGLDKLEVVLEGMNFNEKQLRDVKDFIGLHVKQDEFNRVIEKKAYVSYVEYLEKILKRVEMAQGYDDMGEVNLEISKENFHLEEEGAKLHEMDSERAEDQAK